MKMPHSVVAVAIAIPMLWCIWLQCQLNSAAGDSVQQSTRLDTIAARLAALEVALGFDEPHSLDERGLKRLWSLETRVSAVEDEWSSFPAGTTVQVVRRDDPTTAGDASEAVKARDQQIRDHGKILKSRVMDQLSASRWLPTDAGTKSPSDYPELAEVYNGLPYEKVDFGLVVENGMSLWQFVRVKPFMPSEPWRYPGTGYAPAASEAVIPSVPASPPAHSQPATQQSN